MEDKIFEMIQTLIEVLNATIGILKDLESRLIVVVPNVAVITPESPYLPDKEEQPADTSSAQAINSVQHQKAIDSAQKSPFRDMVPYLSLTAEEQSKATD